MHHLIRDLFFLKHCLHQFIGEHGNSIKQLFPLFFCLIPHIFGNFLVADIITLLTIKINCLHGDQINHPLKIIFKTNGQLDHNRVQIQFVPKLAHYPGRVGTGAVALINKGDTWNIVSCHLAIYGDGLRLDTSHGTEDQNCAVKNSQRAFHLNCKVNMARSINNINIHILPVTVGSCRLDSDSAFFFQLHGVHGRADTILAANLMNGMDTLGIIENTLGKRCLTRIDMGTDSNITNFIQIFVHHLFLSYCYQAADSDKSFILS